MKSSRLVSYASVVLLLFIVGISGCSFVHEGSINSNRYLTPSLLNAAPSKYDKKAVVVKGYFVHEPESSALWDDSTYYPNGELSHCVSLLYAHGAQHGLSKMNKTTAIIEGVFYRNITRVDVVHLGLCNFSGIIVMKVHPL